MNNLLSSGLSPDHVDGLLQSFFKKELPDPWPAPGMFVRSPGNIRRAPWLGSYKRLALVASVALLLFSYVTLAARFPLEADPGLTLDRNHSIGQKLRTSAGTAIGQVSVRSV